MMVKKAYSFFSPEGPKELFKALLVPKYKGYIFFAHNFSLFDSIFILKYLAELTKNPLRGLVKITKKDDKFINSNITHKTDTNINVNLRDSLLLLQSSLDKLCKQFSVPCVCW